MKSSSFPKELFFCWLGGHFEDFVVKKKKKRRKKKRRRKGKETAFKMNEGKEDKRMDGWLTLWVTSMPLLHCGSGSSIYKETAVALL